MKSKKNLGVFITCRTSSKRLPNKCNLKFINQISYIEYILGRTFRIKTRCKKILCTTKNKIDSNLCKLARKFQIQTYRGSTKDKLNRWCEAAKKFKIDFFVTIDGDDPLFDPELIDKAFNQYLKTKVDFIEAKGIICGLFTYGIKTQALKTVCKIKNSNDTEMMDVYFKDTGLFNCAQLQNVNQKFYRDDVRITLDYPKDDRFLRSLINEFKNKKKFISTNQILDIVKRNPKLLLINKSMIKKWKKNQKIKTKLVLKK
jgi:spore coat polysaccharide biosynthesis protein SpsF